MGTDLFGSARGAGTAGAETRIADTLTLALRLTGVKASEGGDRTIDDYVRFSFESAAGTGGTGTVAIEDAPGGLVEIAIDLATGRLRGATLVSFARRASMIADDFLNTLTSQEGLPTFATDVFAADPSPLPRIICTQTIDVLRGEGLGIVRIAAGEPDRVIRAGESLFLFANNALWGFGADRLARADWSRMTG